MSHTYLSFPAAPNLPLAPDQWDRRYQDQFANVLRLYFNQLSRLLQELGNARGGYHLSFPSGAFHQNGVTTLSSNITNNSTTPISVASTAGFPSSGYLLIGSEIIKYTTTTATTFDGTITRGALGTTNVAHTAGAYISEVQGTGSGTAIGTVKLNNTDYSNGVTINPLDNTQIVFGLSGVYNIQISGQILSFANNADDVTLWFAKNGTDIPASASIATVPAIHGGVPGATILSVNLVLDLVANDYLQVKWTTDSGDSVIATYPPGVSPAHPSSPAVILTATFVSAPNE